MFHKVKSVNSIGNYKLSVQFAEGITKVYDVYKLFDKWQMFLILKNTPALFNSVKVDVGGYGISWNDDLGISCDELYANGQIIKTPFDGLMSFNDATTLWNLNESTLRKAISYGKLVNCIDVCKFGKQWVISMDAMRREYGEPKDKITVKAVYI